MYHHKNMNKHCSRKNHKDDGKKIFVTKEEVLRLCLVGLSPEGMWMKKLTETSYQEGYQILSYVVFG